MRPNNISCVQGVTNIGCEGNIYLIIKYWSAPIQRISEQTYHVFDYYIEKRKL